MIVPPTRHSRRLGPLLSGLHVPPEAPQAVQVDPPLEEVLVSGGQRNTANPAKAASLSSIWIKSRVSVGYRATTNDVQEPAVGRTFHWSADGSSIGTVIESYRDEKVRGDIIRARMDTDELLIYAECAHLLTGAL